VEAEIGGQQQQHRQQQQQLLHQRRLQGSCIRDLRVHPPSSLTLMLLLRHMIGPPDAPRLCAG